MVAVHFCRCWSIQTLALLVTRFHTGSAVPVFPPLLFSALNQTLQLPLASQAFHIASSTFFYRTHGLLNAFLRLSGRSCSVLCSLSCVPIFHSEETNCLFSLFLLGHVFLRKGPLVFIMGSTHFKGLYRRFSQSGAVLAVTLPGPQGHQPPLYCSVAAVRAHGSCSARFLRLAQARSILFWKPAGLRIIFTVLLVRRISCVWIVSGCQEV